MKVIIFGATGFIGSNVTEQFTLSGFDVTAVVRKQSNIQFLKKLNIHIIVLEKFSLNELISVITNKDIVCNCIACTGKNGESKDQIWDTEINLTKLIIQASILNKVKRYLQLSSIISYGHKLPGYPINENHLQKPILFYDKIIFQKEKNIKEASQDGLKYIIIQPVTAIGVRDEHAFTSYIFGAHKKNRFPFFRKGKFKFSLIDARDIGRAFVFMTRSTELCLNQSYLVKAYDISWRQLKSELDALSSSNAGTLAFPVFVAKIYGYLSEKLKTNTKINRRTVKLVASNKIYDDNKIRSLGFIPKYNIVDSLNFLDEQKEHSSAKLI